MNNYFFSPSTLNLFVKCPRCFWLAMNKNVKPPRGIFPSLPGGMDIVIKEYFDSYRYKGILPPELEGKIKGRLFNDVEKLNRWRSWKNTDLYYEDRIVNAKLSGALDDCLVDESYYIPLDYKTRGFPLKEDSTTYYQLQLDCYCLMLESKGYKTKRFAYLIYYYPKIVSENGMVEFNVEPIEIETDLENAKKTVRDAVVLLKNPLPERNLDCEYCEYANNVNKVKL